MQLKFKPTLWFWVVGVSVVFSVLWGLYAPEEFQFDNKWHGFAGATIFTFLYPLQWYRKTVRTTTFWAAWAGLVLVHLAIYVYVLRQVERWPLLWFAFITPGEWWILCMVLDKITEEAHPRKRFPV